MAQALFPEGKTIFQDDNAPIHSATIVKKCHEEDVLKLSIFYKQHNLQTSILMSIYGQF